MVVRVTQCSVTLTWEGSWGVPGDSLSTPDAGVCAHDLGLGETRGGSQYGDPNEGISLSSSLPFPLILPLYLSCGRKKLP